MIKVYKGLYLGDDDDCFFGSRSGWKVVHACKGPCFDYAQECLSDDVVRTLEEGVIEAGDHMFLDLVDSIEAPDAEHTTKMVSAALDFIEGNLPTCNVLVHCNVCVSRSPSIVLLYLAKREGVLSQKSYEAARRGFSNYYADYYPSRGIETYLRSHWGEIV